MSKPARGRLYVDRDVQRALVLQLLRHWLVFVTVLTGMLLALETLREPQSSLSGHFVNLWYRHAPLLVVIVSLFPVFVYDSVKLSNRFAGPIMRLRSALREAASGEPARPLSFRKDDFWQDVASSYNALLERLNERGMNESERATQAWGRDEEIRDEEARDEKRALAACEELDEHLHAALTR